MKKLIKKSILLFFIIIPYLSNSQGYSIKVSLSNVEDTVIYLAHYYGDKQYIDDTAFVTKKSHFEFKGKESLKQGMYFVANQKNVKYFDFFVESNQKIEFSCDPYEVTKTMVVKGSKENTLFYDYVKYIADNQEYITKINNILQNTELPQDSVDKLKQLRKNIDNTVKNYIKKITTENPKMLSSMFIKSNIEPDIEALSIEKYGKVDSSQLYFLYKEHYFDNIPLNDERFVYTPILTQKIDSYFDKMIYQIADTICHEMDNIFKKPNISDETKKYLAWHFLVKYETSKIMGFDAVFVYLVRNYLENKKIAWLYPEVETNVVNRVNEIEPLLIGKTAPNLILLDFNNKPHSLYQLKNKYTILFFWESTCGHCSMEVPKLMEFYNNNRLKYNLEVYGVSSDTSMVEMKKYIDKNKMPWQNVNGHYSLHGNYRELYNIRSTPVMFLLDENKKILTKLILTEGIIKYIENREKVKN